MKLTTNGHLAKRLGTGLASVLRQVVPKRLRPIGYLTHLVQVRTDQTVRLGPFARMRYVDRSIESAYLPKLLGTYERELNAVIEQACACRPGLIVDVGAAEGYYAVGLALRNPQTRLIAFECLHTGRAALCQMAQVNGVAARIDVRGRCDPASLETVLKPRKDELLRVPNSARLVLCDVEGDEDVLLDPTTVPSLRAACILVETHEFVRPGITDKLVKRFAPTHRVERIWQTGRSAKEFPFRSLMIRLLPSSYLDWALSEWRPVQMCWLWMKPYA